MPWGNLVHFWSLYATPFGCVLAAAHKAAQIWNPEASEYRLQPGSSRFGMLIFNLQLFTLISFGCKVSSVESIHLNPPGFYISPVHALCNPPA